MPSLTVMVSATVSITHDQPMAAREFASACGADINWVVQLVEVGIVHVSRTGEHAVDWHF